MTREELTALFGRAEIYKQILDNYASNPTSEPPVAFCEWGDELAMDLDRCATWVAESSVELRCSRERLFDA